MAGTPSECVLKEAQATGINNELIVKGNAMNPKGQQVKIIAIGIEVSQLAKMPQVIFEAIKVSKIPIAIMDTLPKLSNNSVHTL